MSVWAEGYVSDIPYALGFYRETVPAHIAFAALAVGKNPGLGLRPRRVLELGIGMGLGFVINAAANPAIEFEGVDFNPLHIGHARGLADAADLSNVNLREASFQDLAREAQEGQQDLDLIVLHGIMTWVSAEAHEAIVEIARKRLKPGGLLYVSYNSMPGWAPVLSMQRLMRENAKRVSGRSDAQTASGIELVKALSDEGAAYFEVNPLLKQRVEQMITMDKNYLAHEYLNANWFIFHFADVAEMFGRAKLNFVASATLAENMDSLSLPVGVRSRIAAVMDPIFKETLRDVASNKQFRRDVFGRGISATTAIEHNELLAQTRFALVVPREKLSLKIPSPLGDLEGNAEIYKGIADLLAKGPASFAEIAALPVFTSTGGATAALQAVTLFVHGGQVLPLPASSTEEHGASQRLNRVIAGKARKGRLYNFLSAPVVGSGLQATNVEILLLDAVLSEFHDKPETLADSLIGRMREVGINWLADGKPISDPEAIKSNALGASQAFLDEKLPVWRQLGML